MVKFIRVIFIIVILGSIFFILTSRKEKVSEERPNLSNMMKLTSSLFENMGLIPSTYTCDGADINPPLSITGVPEGAKSLVLILDDPDAPAGIWTHWVVFNIPPDTKEIKEGVEPTGSQGLTSSKKIGYGGPCPPDREHRYYFKLFALDTKLNLKEGASKKDVEKAMEGHILANTELIGRYNRPR